MTASAVPAAETEAPHALVELVGHTLVVTMNRPERKNALSGEMLAIMSDAWDRVNSDPDVRVCILTGAGAPSVRGWTSRPRTRSRRATP